MTGNGAAGWWTQAFGAAYLDVYAHRDDAAAAREAQFARTTLGMRARDRVLDAGCGAGRHARALAAAGIRVTGLDVSADLLAAAARAGGGARWVRGDLRALPFRSGAFAHVVSFFTSFGYFDESGDRAQLAEFRRVLRAGGGVLLDFLNAPVVVGGLVPRSERRAGARSVRETRAVRAGRVEKSVEVVEAGAIVAAWSESVRLWSRPEIGGLLADAGLRVAAEFGAFDGSPWNPASPRLVVHAEAV